MKAAGKQDDKAWLVRHEGEYRVAYLERDDDDETAEPPLLWWDQNHDTEICEEGKEEAATQVDLPKR